MVCFLYFTHHIIHDHFVPTEEDIKSNKIPSIEEMTYVSGQDRKITVKKNGRTTILIVVEDKAGNKSDIKTVAVKKDNEPPRPFNVSYTNVGPHSFDISAATTDEHSSVVMYRFFVNLNGEEILKGSSKDGKGTIGELEPKQTYIVYVEAEDEAGNKRISTNMQVTTKGEVLPPTIELACSYDETNGWYRGDVDVTIRDSSTDDKSDLASITYRVEGANELTQRTEPGRITTFKATEEGISNVIAFGTGIGGNITEESTKEIKLDKTAPEVPTINVTGGTDGLNGWYKKGPVTVTINAGEDVKKDGVTDISETKGVIYEITGAMTKTVTNPVQSGIQENITQDGITTITAQTVDNAGNVSEKCGEVQVKIDGIAPEVPTITLDPAKANGSNGWYKQGNITATISAEGKDAQSGAWQIEYTVGSKTQKTEAGKVTQTVIVDTDGTTTIKAKTIDKAGNKSTKEATATIKRDVTEPTKAELKVNSYDKTGINVTAKGEDATSGIVGYQFQYKKSIDDIWQNSGSVQASTSNTLTYNYTGLKSGKTYDLRVILIDEAGNTKEGEKITANPQESNYYIKIKGVKEWYDKFAEAYADTVSGANDENGGTIYIAKDVVENVEQIELSKTIAIDTNRHTMQRNSSIVVADGTLTVKGESGKILTDEDTVMIVLKKNGNIQTSGMPIIQGGSHGIIQQDHSTGTIHLNGGIITSTGRTALAIQGQRGRKRNWRYYCVYSLSCKKWNFT